MAKNILKKLSKIKNEKSIMNQNITDTFELDSHYSTTRRVRQTTADIVAAELKAAHKPEDAFETLVFLPEGQGRQGEGGLRTQGYFKLSTVDKPLITVVTVVFNGEKLLEETILSVINQTYDNVEYIIIDGGSADGTLDIIKKYEHAIDYWVSEKDKGIYDAMNKCIDLSFGNGIVFMNAGDYFVGEVLNFIDYIPCLLRVKHKNFLGLVKELIFKNPKQGMPYCHQGIVFDNKIKMHYDLSYSISSDYDFLIKKGVEKQPILNSTGYVYYDDNGISSKNIILRDKESSKIIMNNFGFFYYCLFIVKSWVKVKIKKLLKVIV